LEGWRYGSISNIRPRCPGTVPVRTARQLAALSISSVRRTGTVKPPAPLNLEHQGRRGRQLLSMFTMMRAHSIPLARRQADESLAACWNYRSVNFIRARGRRRALGRRGDACETHAVWPTIQLRPLSCVASWQDHFTHRSGGELKLVPMPSPQRR
jgi:hypothetical protein